MVDIAIDNYNFHGLYKPTFTPLGGTILYAISIFRDQRQPVCSSDGPTIDIHLLAAAGVAQRMNVTAKKKQGQCYHYSTKNFYFSFCEVGML